MRRPLYVVLMVIALTLPLLTTNLSTRSLAQPVADKALTAATPETYSPTVTPCPLGLPPHRGAGQDRDLWLCHAARKLRDTEWSAG
ncbi:MAG: hypothetical protein F6K00_31930 [Leptolyngbya sp. SIOISBB]|nr:hypothetical protein [Leptolyngbya sp. SIOISBB]